MGMDGTCSVCGGPCSRYSETCRPCSGYRSNKYIDRYGVTLYEMLASNRRMEILEVDSNGCWLFTGALNHEGYGVLRDPVGGKFQRAHRVVYSQLVRPLAKNEALDHLCRVRNCCNPDHLQPLSHSENSRRAIIDKQREQQQIGRMLHLGITATNIAYVFGVTATMILPRVAYARKMD